MHFSTLILPFFAIHAHASSIQPRQALPNGQTVKQDILDIDEAVRELDVTVNAYQGVPLPTSIVEGKPVLLGVAKIHEVNRAGFRHALAAPTFTVEDSNQIIDTILETVNISIPKAIQDMKAKSDAFKEGGLTTVVIASLTLLLYDHDTFSLATGMKFNPGISRERFQEAIDAVINIQNVILDGILFYTASLV